MQIDANTIISVTEANQNFSVNCKFKLDTQR